MNLTEKSSRFGRELIFAILIIYVPAGRAAREKNGGLQQAWTY